MSEDKTSQAAASRLKTFSTQLKKAYQRAGDHVGESLTPVEEAIAEIDEPWLPRHFAESFKTDGPAKARRPQSCFATEAFANGDKGDYLLCAARKNDRRCGLYVSYCQYNVKPATGDPQEVAIRESFLVSPAKLPLPLRLKALDALDTFAEEYEAYVRRVRGDILDRFGQSTPSDKSEQASVSKPEPEPEPESAPAEASPEDETILEDTEIFSEEDIRGDILAPLGESAPTVKDEEEKVEEEKIEEQKEESEPEPEPEPVQAETKEPEIPEEHEAVTPSEPEHTEEEKPVEKKAEPHPHTKPSHRLEEAEAKISLKSWV